MPQKNTNKALELHLLPAGSHCRCCPDHTWAVSPHPDSWFCTQGSRLADPKLLGHPNLYIQYNDSTLTGCLSSFPPHPQGHTFFLQNARNSPLPLPSGNQRLPNLQAFTTDSSPAWHRIFSFSRTCKEAISLCHVGLNFPQDHCHAGFPWHWVLLINQSLIQKDSLSQCPLEPKSRPSTLSSCRHCLAKAAMHPYCFTTDSNSAIWVPKVFRNLVMAKTSWNWVHWKHLVEQNSMLKPGMKKHHTYNLSTWGGSRGRRTTINLRTDLSVLRKKKKKDN